MADKSAILSCAFEDTRGFAKGSRDHRKYISGLNDSEANLEELVFGRQPFLGAATGTGDSDYENTDESSDDEDRTERVEPRKPAWHDEDDDVLRVDIGQDRRLKWLRQTESESVISGHEYRSRLRAEFQKTNKQPEWAIADTKRRRTYSSSDEDEASLLQQSGNLLTSSVHNLPKGIIEIKKLKDVNASKRPPAVLQSVEFHPSANVVLTAGLHKTLDLFQVDCDSNPLLQSVHLERFPITTAHFDHPGEEIVLTGQRKWFYVYDIMGGKVTRIPEIRGHQNEVFTNFEISPDNRIIAFVGKDGYIPLVSNKTKQWIADLKMNGTVRAIAFTPDSRYLLSMGNDAEVYVWELATRSCVHKFVDEGSVVGHTLAVSPDGLFFACGSDSGVVNIYDETCLHAVKPHPLKTVMNLTTSVSSMKFNHTSDILAISSKRKISSMKLLHIPSMTVFSNWPSSRTMLGYVFSQDFSADSKLMVTGNDRGRAQLYRLNHYYKGETVQ